MFPKVYCVSVNYAFNLLSSIIDAALSHFLVNSILAPIHVAQFKGQEVHHGKPQIEITSHVGKCWLICSHAGSIWLSIHPTFQLQLIRKSDSWIVQATQKLKVWNKIINLKFLTKFWELHHQGRCFYHYCMLNSWIDRIYDSHWNYAAWLSNMASQTWSKISFFQNWLVWGISK